MKFILLVICVFAFANAIRVPTRWHNGLQHRKHPIKAIRNDKYFNKLLPSKLHKFSVLSHNPKQKFRRKLIKPNRPVSFHNFYRTPQNQFADVSSNMNTWVPIASPFAINTNVGYQTPKQSWPLDLTQHPEEHFKQASSQYTQSPDSPLHKNYRDDKTFENDDEREEYITDSTPEIDRPSEVSVKSEHEEPLDIPTKPIYPGEKIWAKPGKKHKPHISKHAFPVKEENQDDQLDGYEIFKAGEKLLDKKRVEFENHSRNQHTKEEAERIDVGSSEDLEEESENEEDAEEFVPMTLYTQVRRTGNEEHLPSDSDDSESGRLKEVIRDSKIHTVYTEEGYDDSAYDHAGHEKEAEDSEGYSEFNNEEEQQKEPQQNTNNEHSEDGDQINEGSSNIFKTAEFTGNIGTRQNKKPSKELPQVKNNFVKTKEIKMMKLKTNSDGSQMQITSGVRMNMSPVNGSDKEVIEVMPKVVEYIPPKKQRNKSNASVKQNLSDETTTLPKILIRKRRFTNDLPKIDVKEDFIRPIEQSDIPAYREEIQQNKYPYYNVEYLNKNSPLRYSENMDNIPLKEEGEMSFYQQTNKIQCPEVNDDIDAIPQRVKEVEEAVNNGEKIEDTEDAGKSPRLGKLGERISCLKRKFFGDKPLDSPFFEETTVGPVLSPFKIFEKKQAGFQDHYRKTDQIQRSSSNIEKPIERKYHSRFSIQERKQKPIENNSVALSSNSDTEELVPTASNRDIANEAESQQGESDKVEIVGVNNFSRINQIINNAPSIEQKKFQTPIETLPNNIYDKIELVELPTPQIIELPAIGVSNEREAKLVDEASNQSIQAAELRMNFIPNRYHPFPKIPQKNWYRRPQPNIDPNAYLLNQYGKMGINKRNNYNLKTILHQNEQIIPLEQLNVFSDVLNNIKNGTNDLMRAGSSYSVPNRINNFYKPIANVQLPTKKIHVKTSDLTKYLNSRNAFQVSSSTTTTTTSSPTQKPKRGGIKYKNTTERDLYEDDYLDVTNDQIFGKKTITGKKSTSVPEEKEEEEDSQVSETHTTETINNPTIAKTTEILGLVPPSTWKYRTIYQPAQDSIPDSSISGSENLNRYHVLGMKPPSTIRNIYNIQKRNIGKGMNRFYNKKLRRGKRSPNRKSYFEVVRTQKPTEANIEDNEDDYVPHRSKNWHWDETLKKIVYNKPKKEEIESEEEEIEEEIEIEDSIPKNIQQTTTRRPFIVTTPLNGPSYVDFIKLLKSNKNYVSIPDPTTPKKGIKIEETTVATTTVTSAPTKPPEFLNILSKIRKSESYVMIKDKNATKITTTTTTESPDEEIEEYIEDSEPALSNMQNSPGKGAVDIGHNLKIFDVNDYLPHVKSYSPRTAIDYSKYKTIQRTPSKVSTTEPTEGEEEDGVDAIATLSSNLQVATPTTEGKLEIIELSRDRYSSTEPITSTTPTTTTHKILRTRGRRPTITSTTTPTSSNSRDNVVIVTASKPKRVYPRRRYPHIRTRVTTERQSDDIDPNISSRNARHNSDEGNEAERKIISLESLIKMEQLNSTKNDTSSKEMVDSTSSTNKSGELVGPQNITVDDILKNINQLKEVNVQEVVLDYEDDSNGSLVQDEFATQQEDFDDESKIELGDEKTKNRRLVISKNQNEGSYRYVSVR